MDDTTNIKTKGKVICLEEARFTLGKCKHLHVLVDSELADVQCQDCGEKLNPIWVLYRLATEESRFDHRRKALMDEREKLQAKQRTKCQHCGKMTRVRTR